METNARDAVSALDDALETSLVEWKLLCNMLCSSQKGALETSLVEWKQLERRLGMEGVKPWKRP